MRTSILTRALTKRSPTDILAASERESISARLASETESTPSNARLVSVNEPTPAKPSGTETRRIYRRG